MLCGALLLAATLVTHGFGMLLTLRLSGAFKARFDKARSFAAGLTTIILASWAIIMVHLIEVFIWAMFFYATNAVSAPSPGPANASLCYYFALCDYTCLGSNYNLVLHWRLPLPIPSPGASGGWRRRTSP